MAVLTIRSVPEDVHRALRVRAAQHGRSTEAEVREILAAAVKPENRVRVGDARQPSAGRLSSRTKTSLSWKASVTGRPPSRLGSYDCPHHQRVRGDEAGSVCERRG